MTDGARSLPGDALELRCNLKMEDTNMNSNDQDMFRGKDASKKDSVLYNLRDYSGEGPDQASKEPEQYLPRIGGKH